MTRNLSRAQTRARSAAITPLAYEVELDVSEAADPARATFPTRTTLRLLAREPETFLDFLGASVEQVEVDGQPREVEFDGARIAVRGLAASEAGTENVVTVRGQANYSRTGEGLHRYVDPVDGRTYLYSHQEPADARRVYADLEQPDLKAPFTFVVTAPTAWEVANNSVEASRAAAPANAAGQTCSRRTFAPTPPMSTYITCVAAGEYVRFDDEWSVTRPDGSTQTVPLGMLCRASLVDAFDADTLFEITKQGLDFFDEAFAYPYPWGKYDSIFVPEYNLGAMENPGLVTFTDARYVFQSGATESQREGRANTILHEMAHMWFGDLVTPAWWDDLWLKESFADYMGTHANAEATRFTDAWTPFCARRKAWAYLQDQLPTTHPIVADIPDVEAARQNFDGITYAKGASVLKQLVAYVGREAFFEGSRAYFHRHEYGSGTLSDLLDVLAEASGRDLREWARLWLETTGVATLTPHVELAPDGTIARLSVEQAGEPLRPHRLVVGLYARTGDALVRTARLEVDVDGASTDVPDAVGLPAPELVVVNDDDLTYAKVRLAEGALPVLADPVAGLTSIESSLTRACLWSALWNACRDGELPAADFVDVMLAQAPREGHVALLDLALGDAHRAIGAFAPAQARPDLRRRLLDVTWEQLHAAEAGTGEQLTWARALARAAGVCDARAADVRALLDGEHVVEGLPLGPELRWQLLTSLAATGHASEADIAAERAADTTSLAPIRALEADAARPDAAVKARVWAEIMAPGPSNDEVQARVDGFAHAGQGALTDPYRGRYLAALLDVWAHHSQGNAQRIVDGLFPGGDLEPGTAPEEQPAVVDVDAWLAAHPDAPGALRRLVVEGRDHLLRALRAQAAAA